MLDRELSKKIDKLITERFPLIYEYDFDGIVLLCGGAVRNTIMNIEIKDLDFVILSQEKCMINAFIKKYNLKYKKNVLGGFKIYFNNFKIDIFTVSDLLEAVVYDVDLLMYDINKHEFINCGALKAIKNNTITQINYDYKVNYFNKNRKTKLINFLKYVNNNNKKVKIHTNNILYLYHSLKYKIKTYFDKIVNGNLKKCLRFINGSRVKFIFSTILILIISLLTVAQPTLLGLIINFIMKFNYKFVFVLVLLTFFIKIIILFLQFIVAKLHLVMNKNMINNIYKEIVNSVLNLDMLSFVNNDRGTFIEKLSQDPKEIVKNFNAIIDWFIREFANIGILLLVFILDYRIGIVLLFFIFISINIIIKGVRKEKRYMRQYYYSQEKYSSLLGEMINGVDDIKNLNLKDNYTKKIIDSYEKTSENEYNFNFSNRIYKKRVDIVQCVAIFIISLLGLYFVKYNRLDTTALIIIFMYNNTIFRTVNKIGLLISLISRLDVSCERIFTLLDNNIYQNENYGIKYKDKCKGNIEFLNVNFKYDYNSDYVLEKCGFKIGSNELVTIVGKSGEGKTTILNLISRLYCVNDGSVKIDGININEYSEQFIKNNISVISQNPYLFDMSIKDNLRLVKENITDEEIINVCKMVCLDKFIEALPNKYDTVIGEGGIRLSGGQKQRLGIARALIKNTKIILLDEITSALDNETGSIIKSVINNIKKNHTIIIVTHELSMIKDSDRILVLDSGKIVGDGEHEELIKKNAIYKKIYKIK